MKKSLLFLFLSITFLSAATGTLDGISHSNSFSYTQGSSGISGSSTFSVSVDVSSADGDDELDAYANLINGSGVQASNIAKAESETELFDASGTYTRNLPLDFESGAESTFDGLDPGTYTVNGYIAQEDDESESTTGNFGPTSDNLNQQDIGTLTINGDTLDADYYIGSQYSDPTLEDDIAFYDDSNNANSYSWDMGNGETVTGEDITYSYSEVGEYDVTLTVNDGNGNTDTHTQTVDVDWPDGYRTDYLEAAINRKLTPGLDDEIRGLGLTDNPYLGTCNNGWSPDSHRIIAHHNAGGIQNSLSNVAYEPKVGSTLDPNSISNNAEGYGNNLDYIWKDGVTESGYESRSGCGDLAGDYGLNDVDFNQDGSTQPKKDECGTQGRFSCNLAYNDGNGYWWDIKGEVLVTDDKFVLCDSDVLEGQNVTANGYTYECSESSDSAVSGEWEVSGGAQCPDPAIVENTTDPENNTVLLWDNGGSQYQDPNQGCSYGERGLYPLIDETHPADEPQSTVNEPYVFQCEFNVDNNGNANFDQLSGFDYGRFDDGSSSVYGNYTQAREEIAIHRCKESIDTMESQFPSKISEILDHWHNKTHMVEFYTRGELMPKSQNYPENPTNWEKINHKYAITPSMQSANPIDDNKHPQLNSDYEGLKHFQFQPLFTAHLWQDSGRRTQFGKYRPNQSIQQDECSNADVLPPTCGYNWEAMDWGDDFEYITTGQGMAGSELQINDLYGDPDSPWNISNTNGYKSSNVQKANTSQERPVHSENRTVFKGGWTPNCKSGLELRYVESEQMWRCVDPTADYTPEIFLPEISKLGSSNDFIDIGLFFPPSTFEYYTGELGDHFLINQGTTFTEEEWIIAPNNADDDVLDGENHNGIDDDAIIVDLERYIEIQNKPQTDYENAILNRTFKENGQEIKNDTSVVDMTGHTTLGYISELSIYKSEFNNLDDLVIDTTIYLEDEDEPQGSSDRIQFVGQETAHRISRYPKNRTFLGETDQQTFANAIERENNPSVTPRIRGIDVVCAVGDENRVTPGNIDNIPNSQKFERTIEPVPRPPENEMRGESVGVNGPLPVTPGPQNTGFDGAAIRNQGFETITCMWRYRYVGSNNEKWFTSGEANNLANDDYVQSLPGLAVTGDLQDVAENRTWEGHQYDILADTMTESHMLDWKNRWNMTFQEEGDAESKNQADGYNPGSLLDFGSSERETMINNIIARVT